jgi:hypothetical protein
MAERQGESSNCNRSRRFCETAAAFGMSETMFSFSRCEKLVAERQGFSFIRLYFLQKQRLTTIVLDQNVTGHCISINLSDGTERASSSYSSR